MRAQISLEALLIFAAALSALALLAPVAMRLYQATVEAHNAAIQSLAATTLFNAIDEIEVLGIGSVTERALRFSKATQIDGNGKEIRIRFELNGRERSLKKSTSTHTLASLSLEAGLHRLSIAFTKDGIVISEAESGSGSDGARGN